jgi:hypothetical protein
VPDQGRVNFSTLCIPQVDGFVLAAAGKHGSVGAPRNSSDIVRVPAQGRHALTRVGVPDLDRIVSASTGYFAVGAPCHRGHPAFAMR